jgi:hypothetical protein
MGVSGQRHAPAALYPRGKDPRFHCTGGWVGPRAGLDTEARGKILYPCRVSNPDRPVVQLVVRHYTAWANPALEHVWYNWKHLLLTACPPLRYFCSQNLNVFTSYSTRKGLGSLSSCAVALRSSPPSHVSTCNGQRSSQLFCVHYTWADFTLKLFGLTDRQKYTYFKNLTWHLRLNGTLNLQEDVCRSKQMHVWTSRPMSRLYVYWSMMLAWRWQFCGNSAVYSR